MPDSLDFKGISENWNTFELICRNPRNIVFSAVNKDGGFSAVVTYMVVASNTEKLVQAMRMYHSVSARANLLPLTKCEVFKREDGKLDVYVFSPYVKQLTSVPLDDTQKRGFALQTGRALEALHASEIIHGGVNPGNILSPNGNVWYLAGQTLTQELAALADTLHNPAPGIAPDSEPGVEDDIYAFGKLLYYIYNDYVLPEQIETPPKNAPQPVADIIMQICSGQRGQHTASAKELCDALEEAYSSKAEINRSIKTIYPELEVYFSIFDPEASTAYFPPEVKKEAPPEKKIHKRQEHYVLGAILAVAAAAALIIFFVIYGLLKTPKIDTSEPSASPSASAPSAAPTAAAQQTPEPPVQTAGDLPYTPEEPDLRSAEEMTLQPVYSGQMDAFPSSAELPEGALSVRFEDGYAESVPADAVDVLSDVVYDQRDGEDLTLQILLPKSREEGTPLPLVMYIPGSAWMRQSTAMSVPVMARVAARGFAVAIVEYRGTDVAFFPAQAEDAKTAIRFMRKNAAEYGIDTERIALWGDSSGGHTAVLAGITGDGVLDNGTYGEYSSSVNCIVDWYGPTDISLMNYYPSMMDHTSPSSPEGMLIGGLSVPENPDKAALANPIQYLSGENETPPVLIMHGSRDPLVPFNQSVRLFEKLKELGKTAEMLKLEDAGHGSGGFAGDEALERVTEFLSRCL